MKTKKSHLLLYSALLIGFPICYLNYRKNLYYLVKKNIINENVNEKSEKSEKNEK